MKLPPGYKFVLLSLDTAIDVDLGNLDGSNWATVLEFLELGIAALGLTGPLVRPFRLPGIFLLLQVFGGHLSLYVQRTGVTAVDHGNLLASSFCAG